MKSHMVAARALCSKAELALVLQASTRELKAASVGDLRKRLLSARRLHDKYRTLARRRQKATHGDANTKRKRDLFAAVLERFSDAHAKASKAAAEQAEAPKRKVKKKVAKKAKVVKKTAVAKKSAKKKAAPKTVAGAAAARRRKLSKEDQPPPLPPAGAVQPDPVKVAAGLKAQKFSEKTKASRIRNQKLRSNRQKILGHVKGRERRSQGSRDGRGG